MIYTVITLFSFLSSIVHAYLLVPTIPMAINLVVFMDKIQLNCINNNGEYFVPTKIKIVKHRQTQSERGQASDGGTIRQRLHGYSVVSRAHTRRALPIVTYALTLLYNHLPLFITAIVCTAGRSTTNQVHRVPTPIRFTDTYFQNTGTFIDRLVIQLFTCYTTVRLWFWFLNADYI